MKTSEMSVSALWRHHYANPNNQILRAAIALRDPAGIRQLQPLLGRCIVMEAEGRIEEIQNAADEQIEYLSGKLDDAPDNDAYDKLETKNEELEDDVERLTLQVEDLKEQLAEQSK